MDLSQGRTFYLDAGANLEYNQQTWSENTNIRKEASQCTVLGVYDNTFRAYLHNYANVFFQFSNHSLAGTPDLDDYSKYGNNGVAEESTSQ